MSEPIGDGGGAGVGKLVMLFFWEIEGVKRVAGVVPVVEVPRGGNNNSG